MFVVLSFILFIGIVMIATIVLRDASKYAPDLLSMRNLFLAGLVVFQFTSGIIAFLLPDYSNPFSISEYEGPAIEYTIILFLFTFGFLGIYRSGFIANIIVRKVNIPDVNTAWFRLIVLSIVLFFLGLVCRLFGGYVPVVGLFIYMIGASFFAFATGMAAWAWAPRMWNPLPLFVTGFVSLGGLAVLFTDSFGRRDMLGIVIAFIWGSYYSHWRYGSFKKLVFRFACISVLGMLFLSAYTSTRFTFGLEMASLSSRVRALADADIGQGLQDLFSGQNAGMYSMYFISTRPERIEVDNLHSVKYFFSLPYPRRLWPNKPDALALTSVDEVHAPGRPKGWNIGPGIVGHMVNDNIFIALPLYTCILAVFLKVCDGLLSKYAHIPYVVLPMGVSLGQVIAIPRGELGNFFAKTVLYIVGGWIVMIIVIYAMRLFGGSSALVDDEEHYDQWENDPADEYTDQGFEPEAHH